MDTDGLTGGAPPVDGGSEERPSLAIEGGADVATDAPEAEAGPELPVLGCLNGGGLQTTAIWPMLGGCPTHGGRGRFRGPASTPFQRWKISRGGNSYSGVAIAADGTCYFGTEETNALVAAKSDGTLLHEFPTLGNVTPPPSIAADGTIYAGGSGLVFAGKPDGTKKWSVPIGDEADSNPLVDTDGTVYFGNDDNELLAVLPNGDVKWRYNLGGSARFSNAALSVDGTIYIGNDRGRVHAVTRAGANKWVVPLFEGDGGDTRGIVDSPTIGTDGTIYVTSGDSKVYAITPAGTVKWSYPTGAEIRSVPALTEQGDIIIAGGDGYLRSLRPDGTEAWKYNMGAGVELADPFIDGAGTIYIGTYDGRLHAVNPDGTLKWVYAVGERPMRQPVVGPDGNIYVVTTSGSGQSSLRCLGL